MNDNQRHTTEYRGTPITIEAQIRAFFEYQRHYLRCETPEDDVDDTLEKFERTGWMVEITPLDVLAKERISGPANVCEMASMIDNERELYRFVGAVGDGTNESKEA